MPLTEGNIVAQYYEGNMPLHDAIKTLRANIRFSTIDKDAKTIVVTSVLPNEGKSTLTSYLGIAMAEEGRKTLLVECDMRKPIMRYYFQARPERDVADALRAPDQCEDCIMPTEIAGMDVLFGRKLPNPVEVLGSNSFWNLIQRLSDQYDTILLDTPPLGSFIEAALLAAKADGTLLVVQQGTTDLADARAVVGQLKKANAHIMGVALNNVSKAEDPYQAGHYYYEGETKRHKRRFAKGKKMNKEQRDLFLRYTETV